MNKKTRKLAQAKPKRESEIYAREIWSRELRKSPRLSDQFAARRGESGVEELLLLEAELQRYRPVISRPTGKTYDEKFGANKEAAWVSRPNDAAEASC